MGLTVICLKCIAAVEIIDTAPSPGVVDANVVWMRCHNEYSFKSIPRWKLQTSGDERATLGECPSFSTPPTEAASRALASLLGAGEQFDFFMRVLESCGDKDRAAKEHADAMAAAITRNYQLLERLSQRLLGLVEHIEKQR